MLREAGVTAFPRSLIEFQQRFPDEAACVRYLFAARWPNGFVCPGCGSGRAWALQTKPWTWECDQCRRQTSVTAGTLMHHSKLPLTIWFWAAYLMATHSNGISALQLQRQLALGSYKSAWLLCAKLRGSMVAPDRSPLAGVVEVDETEIACRSKHDPVSGGSGRSHQGKILVVGAVEVEEEDGGPGRIRLPRCPTTRPPACIPLLPTTSRRVLPPRPTDGRLIRRPWRAHDPHVVGKIVAHIVLPWVHRIFANLKVWALGVYHGLRRRHLQSYLDEFVLRFNRRHHRHAGFRSLTRHRRRPRAAHLQYVGLTGSNGISLTHENRQGI